MIILDYSGTAISNLFANGLSAGGHVDEGMLRHMILNQIRTVYTKHRNTYGKMIIAYDAGGNWRRNVYAQYKACRKTSRDGDAKDWDAIFESLNKIKNEIKAIMPYLHIEVYGCEADDVIGTLVHEVFGGTAEKTLIVSSDHDFKQLQEYPNVRQWAAREKKFVDEKDPKGHLFEKIMRGDKGDGVPNVLSPDDCFVEGIRQTPVKKTLIEEMSKLTEEQRETTLGDNYIRNRAMVSLRHTPQEYQDTILAEYRDPKNLPDGMQVFNYFIESKLKNLIGSIDDFLKTPNQTQNDSIQTTTHRLFA